MTTAMSKHFPTPEIDILEPDTGRAAVVDKIRAMPVTWTTRRARL